MPLVAWIIVFSVIGSVVSLAGGIVLLLRERLARDWSTELAAFAAGTLLGTAFFDLLPEALAVHGAPPVLFAALGGFLAFLLFERSVLMIHVHHTCEREEDCQVHASTPLIIIGDTVHNLLDGMVIGGTFLAGVPVGILASIAVAAHEIPQEIGDFIILLRNGMRRSRVLAVNLFSACATIAGALGIWLVGDRMTALMPHFLGATAGFFIYIAAVDLIPETHHSHDTREVLRSTIALLAGVVVIGIATRLVE